MTPTMKHTFIRYRQLFLRKLGIDINTQEGSRLISDALCQLVLNLNTTPLSRYEKGIGQARGNKNRFSLTLELAGDCALEDSVIEKTVQDYLATGRKPVGILGKEAKAKGLDEEDDLERKVSKEQKPTNAAKTETRELERQQSHEIESDTDSDSDEDDDEQLNFLLDEKALERILEAVYEQCDAILKSPAFCLSDYRQQHEHGVKPRLLNLSKPFGISSLRVDIVEATLYCLGECMMPQETVDITAIKARKQGLKALGALPKGCFFDFCSPDNPLYLDSPQDKTHIFFCFPKDPQSGFNHRHALKIKALFNHILPQSTEAYAEVMIDDKMHYMPLDKALHDEQYIFSYRILTETALIFETEFSTLFQHAIPHLLPLGQLLSFQKNTIAQVETDNLLQFSLAFLEKCDRESLTSAQTNKINQLITDIKTLQRQAQSQPYIVLREALVKVIQGLASTTEIFFNTKRLDYRTCKELHRALASFQQNADEALYAGKVIQHQLNLALTKSLGINHAAADNLADIIAHLACDKENELDEASIITGPEKLSGLVARC